MSIEIVNQPENFIATAGTTSAWFYCYAVETGGGTVSYQWQYKNNSVDWSNSGASGSRTPVWNGTLTGGIETYVEQGYEYRCAVTSGGTTVYSNPAHLVVYEEPPSSIEIVLQPQTIYYTTGTERAVLTCLAVSSDSSPLSYQWEYRTPNSDWANASATGNQSSTMYLSSISETVTDNIIRRCKITDGVNTVYSNVVSAIRLTGGEQFSIILQRNNSENIHVVKDLTDVITLSGNLKDDCSLIDPVILIEAPLSTVAGCNYCTISAFGRKYYIQNMVSVTTELIEIHCHVDVLYSFANEIKANKGIVRKAEKSNTFNLYINDKSLVAYQDPYILTEPFPAGFTHQFFVLAVASG